MHAWGEHGSAQPRHCAARTMLDRVDVTDEVMLACLTHAMTTEAEEVMGLLMGDIQEEGDGLGTRVARIWMAYPQIRTDRRKDRVESSPEQMARCSAHAERLSRETGVRCRVVGWYHSHPHITVLPSHVDVRTQAMYQLLDPGFVGLIFSVFNNDAGPSKAGRVQITAFQSAPPGTRTAGASAAAPCLSPSGLEPFSSAELAGLDSPTKRAIRAAALEGSSEGELVGRPIPLQVVRATTAVEQSLHDYVVVQRVLALEEKEAFTQAMAAVHTQQQQQQQQLHHHHAHPFLPSGWSGTLASSPCTSPPQHTMPSSPYPSSPPLPSPGHQALLSASSGPSPGSQPPPRALPSLGAWAAQPDSTGTSQAGGSSTRPGPHQQQQLGGHLEGGARSSSRSTSPVPASTPWPDLATLGLSPVRPNQATRGLLGASGIGGTGSGGELPGSPKSPCTFPIGQGQGPGQGPGQGSERLHGGAGGMGVMMRARSPSPSPKSSSSPPTPLLASAAPAASPLLALATLHHGAVYQQGLALMLDHVVAPALAGMQGLLQQQQLAVQQLTRSNALLRSALSQRLQQTPGPGALPGQGTPQPTAAAAAAAAAVTSLDLLGDLQLSGPEQQPQ
ncbi:JAB1/Mov34/MPN/PAD-1 ubiquitin protease-domain-containing protein [Haematococcus lacustris]